MDWKADKSPSEAWHMTDSLHAEHGKGDPFAAAIRATRMSMIITDPRQDDNPIVFANDAFLKLTGYRREEILGRNCRFLQGPDTDPAAIDQIRDAVAETADVSVDVLNYRKDGSTFWNALYLSPVSNEKGELQFFFASQLDVTERKQFEQKLSAEKERFEEAVQARTSELQHALDAQETLLHEVDHRVKNNLQMISSLIVMQSRSITDATTKRSLGAMMERIEAISTVHRRLYQARDVSRFDVAQFIRDLVTDLLAASGRETIKSAFDLETVVVPAEQATPIALMINELVTNALKHAFGDIGNGASSGIVGVTMRRHDGHVSIEVYDNGHGFASTNDGASSFGMKLIRSLARQLSAAIEWRDGSPGTRVTITLPAGKDITGG